MPNLKDILKDSFIFTSNPSPLDIGKDKSVNARGTQWIFSQNSTNSEITDLICKSQGMEMLVCTKIKWENIKVNVQNTNFELKLTSEFLVKKYYSGEGEIKKSDSELWVLPADADPCLAMIYGFQYDFSNKKFVPIKPEQLEEDTLMPALDEKPKDHKLSLTEGKTHKIKISHLRIIVCLEFATCKKKADFEPVGLLDAAKFSPHILLMSNVKLSSFDAAIEIERPPEVGHHHKEETMNAKITPLLFTDNNNSPHKFFSLPHWYTSGEPLFPYWDAIFDNYNLNPANGEYVVVDPANKSKPPKFVKAIKYTPKDGFEYFVTALDPPQYENRPIDAMDRQGLFDNFHLAPSMVAEKKIRDKRKGYALSDIKMAPICVHDCLHMHWRWGKYMGLAGKAFRGWDSNNKPYNERGAPMVPRNQKVTICIKNSHSFIYKVSANGDLDASKWHVVMHHGLSYAVAISDNKSMNQIRDVCTSWTEDIEKEINRTSWPMFYWNLRFAPSEKNIPGKRAFYPRLLIEE